MKHNTYMMGVTRGEYNELEFLRIAMKHIRLTEPRHSDGCDICIYINDYFLHGEIPDTEDIEYIKGLQS